MKYADDIVSIMNDRGSIKVPQDCTTGEEFDKWMQKQEFSWEIQKEQLLVYFVFTYFLDELKKGRTPNPDLMCNKFIKFDILVLETKITK